jgi:ribosome maturation factor RimP
MAASIQEPASRLAAELQLEILAIEALTKEGRRTLVVTVDKPHLGLKGSAVTIEDCGALSKRISDLLDDMYPGDDYPDYTLEVSSPGLDRPIKSEAELNRYQGRLMKLTLRQNNRSQTYVGRVVAVDDGYVLEVEPQKELKSAVRLKKKAVVEEKSPPISFIWGEIVKCRLVPEL